VIFFSASVILEIAAESRVGSAGVVASLGVVIEYDLIDELLMIVRDKCVRESDDRSADEREVRNDMVDSF
jgi:hypothetical protein